MSDLSLHDQSVIDALTAHIALLDKAGNIVAVNATWRSFADDNGCLSPAYGVGSNYLELLRRLAGNGLVSDEERQFSARVVTAIEQVIEGGLPRFQIEYPCHAPDEERWFLLTVTHFPPGHQAHAVVAHENITAQKQAELAARRQGVRLAEAFSSMIAAIGLAIEKRDPYTAGHQRQVASLAVEIGRMLGLDEGRLFGLHLGATIHDIGKISIPADILNRPGGLSSPEYAIIREHSAVGEEILHGIDFPWPIAQMVSQHHERLDGSGYPRGLQGDEICLEAKIIAVADVFDAIVSHRPYRPGLPLALALEELRTGRGRIYDAQVVDAGLSFFPDVDADWHKQHRGSAEAFRPLI